MSCFELRGHFHLLEDPYHGDILFRLRLLVHVTWASRAERLALTHFTSTKTFTHVADSHFTNLALTSMARKLFVSVLGM